MYEMIKSYAINDTQHIMQNVSCHHMRGQGLNPLFLLNYSFYYLLRYIYV